MLGYVAGPVHTDVWSWWVAVHHDLTPGGGMNMAMPGPSPAGRAAWPAASPFPGHDRHGALIT